MWKEGTWKRWSALSGKKHERRDKTCCREGRTCELVLQRQTAEMQKERDDIFSSCREGEVKRF